MRTKAPIVCQGSPTRRAPESALLSQAAAARWCGAVSSTAYSNTLASTTTTASQRSSPAIGVAFVERFENVADVRHVHRESQSYGAMTIRLCLAATAQAHARQSVDGFTEADAFGATEPIDFGGNVVVQAHRRAHDTHP